MNNAEILDKALSYQFTREQLMIENQLMIKEEGLYSLDFGGMVNIYGMTGMFQIIHYCRENNLKPFFIPLEPPALDGGEIIFIKEKNGDD